MTIDETVAILGDIAKSFSPRSKKYKALLEASHMLLFLQNKDIRDQYEQHINAMNRPFCGLEILHCKICGIDIPKGCQSPEGLTLESEIEALAAKIRGFIPNRQ